jgi:tRNA threonylcarbamoyl adenosine modification protein (Sua5/YciO/YrdC/YwlC family)
MQTEVIKLDGGRADEAKIKEAADIVDAGGLVAFPTETVYGIACRVRTDSLGRLSELKGRAADKYYTLHISDKGETRRYVPRIGIRGQKLIERAWPGPLTMVFEIDPVDVQRQQAKLEIEVFENLCRDNSIGIRCPDNAVASTLLWQIESAVVAPSANAAGRPPAVNAEEVLAQLSGRIEMVLDGGPCKYGKSSTVAKVGRKGLEILRPGMYPQAELEAISQVRFLFVCTGNSCRSPMAEGIFRKYLAEKLGCEVDQLGKMGYKVASAGVIDTGGFPASAEAIAACAAKGVDIRAHRSTALSVKLIDESDYIFAMCRTHRQHVVGLRPEAGQKCVLLAEDEEVPDPIGQSQHVYDSCADMIEKAVGRRIGELVI